MNSDLQRNFITFLVGTLVGTWLCIYLTRGQAPTQKRRAPIDIPTAHKQTQRARAEVILGLKPHTLGGSIISLN